MHTYKSGILLSQSFLVTVEISNSISKHYTKKDSHLKSQTSKTLETGNWNNQRTSEPERNADAKAHFNLKRTKWTKSQMGNFHSHQIKYIFITPVNLGICPAIGKSWSKFNTITLSEKSYQSPNLWKIKTVILKNNFFCFAPPCFFS